MRIGVGSILTVEEEYFGMVLGWRMHGHQYDRREEYDILLAGDEGRKWFDVYDLFRNKGLEITSSGQE